MEDESNVSHNLLSTVTASALSLYTLTVVAVFLSIIDVQSSRLVIKSGHSLRFKVFSAVSRLLRALNDSSATARGN
jgi:hypothetical protein